MPALPFLGYSWRKFFNQEDIDLTLLQISSNILKMENYKHSFYEKTMVKVKGFQNLSASWRNLSASWRIPCKKDKG
jgi:hypothetical protein